ncbi:MAG: HypC/HybG/HupF family hydrogenase formation chaperone [Pseudomonadota bacterium]
MRIGIPMKVLSVRGTNALCMEGGTLDTVDLSEIGPQPVGSWVLTFFGRARSALSEPEASRIAEALAGLRDEVDGTDLPRRPHLRLVSG